MSVRPSLLGSDVADAIPGFDPSRAQWVVNLDLTSEGADKFADSHRQCRHVPRRQPPTKDRHRSRRRGGRLARGIPGRGGGGHHRRPGPDHLRWVSPTTSRRRATWRPCCATARCRWRSRDPRFRRCRPPSGRIPSEPGLLAGYIGLALVAILLMVYYRAMGIVSIIGLTVFGAILVAVFALLGRYQGLTLTLAGVTGVIVSIGITADSYIIYIERVKEEIRSGRTVRSAADEGFKQAFRTILTADAVSLLGCGPSVLPVGGTGQRLRSRARHRHPDRPLRSPYLHPASDLAAGPHSAGRPRLAFDQGDSQVSLWHRLNRGETTVDFVGKRKIWFRISLAAIAITLIALAARGGLNLGIEFEGGVSVTGPNPAGATVEDIRAGDQRGWNRRRCHPTRQRRSRLPGSNRRARSCHRGPTSR